MELTPEEKKKKKLRMQHAKYMKTYFDRHPDKAEINRVRARERQRRLSKERAEKLKEQVF